MIRTVFISFLISACLLGQEVVELKTPKSNKIIIKLMFRNGSITDPMGKEGLTFATANTIVQGGTSELSFNQIQDKIFPWAARYGVSVDKEVTIFTFAVPNVFINDFYPVIKGLMLTPSFSEADFQRIKVNQQNFVDQVIRSSSDEEYSKKALEDLLFRGTNYQHKKEGTSSGVRNITIEDVKSHYRNYFTRNNLTIGITGNYSDAFLAQLKSDMGALPETMPQLPQPGKPIMPEGINVEIIAKDNAFGSAIFTGQPLAITRANDDFAALMVANSYLGEHRKSYALLYEKLREKRSMNYGDYSYIEWYDNGGANMVPPAGVPRSSNYFSIWIRPVQIAKQLKVQYKELENVKLGHAHFALRMALKAVDDLVKNGMSQKDFEATRTFLRSYSKLYVSNPNSQLGYLLDSRFYGRKDYIKELDTLLAKLTLEDVNQAIRKYWSADNLFVTIVTDKSEAAELAKSLKENLTSPMSYSDIVKNGLPKEILAEDNEVADFKLNVKNVTIVNSADTFK